MTLERPTRTPRLPGTLLLAVAISPGWFFVARSMADTPSLSDAAKLATFESRVEPILRIRCLKCHGAGPKVKGNFRMDSREGMLRGGDLGPAVSPERPGESLILQAIRHEGPEMPPSGKLPPGEIEILTEWVQQGLAWPAGRRLGSPGESTSPEKDRSPSQAAAWAYHPVVRPSVPRVMNQGWVRNPIDAFVLSKLE